MLAALARAARVTSSWRSWGRDRSRPNSRSVPGSSGSSERVRWTGFRSDVGDFMAAADAFVLSSVWEAVALVIQEAVLLGTPVVSDRRRGHRGVDHRRKIGTAGAQGRSQSVCFGGRRGS